MKGRKPDLTEIPADAPKFIPYDDWSALTGRPVEIRLNGCVVQRGVLDLAMPDSSALWLLGTSGQHRRYFSKEEGYEAWISPPRPPTAPAANRCSTPLTTLDASASPAGQGNTAKGTHCRPRTS